ncbi:MAG: hypothetical protein NZ531_05980 [Aquificaceae bacterium]|nr:hypothetical protein [Aquificaceae bacterium]
MKHNEYSVKFAYCLTLLVSSFVLIVQIATSQSMKVRRLKFSPPLKGTEILLEADLPKSQQRRRGIWALDPKTGKVRFLIPNGNRPIWSPKRNYFAYQEYNFVKVIDKKGEFEAILFPDIEDGQLVGWGHNEQWVLYMEPMFQRIEEEPFENFVYLQTIHFAHFNPKEPSLSNRGILDVSEVFPLHHVGNVSISSNGKYIAFEVFKYVPGIGKLNSKIAMAELVKENGALLAKNIRRLTSLPLELMEINPKWSSNSKQIAFEIVDPQKGNRIAHVINLDGTGLKGLRLYREEIYRHVKGKEKLLRVEEGLVTESYMNHDLRILDWLPDNRLVVVESKFKLTRHVSRLDDRFTECMGVWIVDFERRHPSLFIYDFHLFAGLGEDKFLLLSPDKKRLVGGDGVDDFLLSITLLDIPEPQNKDAMQILHSYKAILKRPPHLEPIPLSNHLAVYWMNW